MGGYRLLVQINENRAINRLRQPRDVDLARLKDHVAVGEDRGLAPLSDVFDDLQCARIEALCERIVEQEAANGEDRRIVRLRTAIALQGAQVIRITEFGAQLLKNAPILLRTVCADRLFEVALKVGNDAVVVEQGDRQSTRLNSSH